jgi:hypothetical protein
MILNSHTGWILNLLGVLLRLLGLLRLLRN